MIALSLGQSVGAQNNIMAANLATMATMNRIGQLSNRAAFGAANPFQLAQADTFNMQSLALASSNRSLASTMLDFWLAQNKKAHEQFRKMLGLGN